MTTIYYFDPEGDACEACELAAGWYDSYPDDPHDNCNCVVQEHELGEESGACRIEYRDILLIESSSDGEYAHNGDFNQCGQGDQVSGGNLVSVFSGTTEIDDMPGQLRTVLEDEAGWDPPEVDVDVGDRTVQGNTYGHINYHASVYTADASAEVFAVCEAGGEVFEEHLETLSGTYECIFAVDVDIETEPCGDGWEEN
jgi:hypothetical protein